MHNFRVVLTNLMTAIDIQYMQIIMMWLFCFVVVSVDFIYTIYDYFIGNEPATSAVPINQPWK